MPAEVVMPRLTDSMEEGKVVRWLKREGEPVERGEALAEIETDKAVMQMESFESGTMGKMLLEEGQSAPIGETIAYVQRPGETPTVQAPQAEAAKAPTAPPQAAPQEEAVVAGVSEAPVVAEERAEGIAAPAERIKASPIARRLAEERGVDLASVRGTGPDGRITREDVEGYAQRAPAMEEKRPAMAPPPTQPAPPVRAPAAPPPPTPPLAAPGPETEVVELSRMQMTIAKRMTESKTTAPHFYATTEIDMAEIARLRRSLNAALGEENQVSYNDFIIKAAALVLRRFPDVNAFYRDGTIERHRDINIAVAVALPEGLMTPVLHNVDQKSISQIAVESRGIAERTRSGRLSAGDLEGGTFTLSNLGMYDVDEFQAIINPPQSAILAIGAIRPKPVVVDGQIVISDRMRATLSADHRVFYGVTAAQYLQELKRLLQNPVLLI